MARAKPKDATPSRAGRSPAVLLCKNCGGEFEVVRSDQRCCSVECNNENRTRELLRGRQLYRLAYLWRTTRSGADAEAALNGMRQVVGEWVAEDKAEGRPPGI